MLDVLADDADFDDIFRVVDAVHQVVPLGQIALFCLDVAAAQDERIHFFMGEHDRHFVDDATSFAVITASSSTLQKRAIFRLISFGGKRSVRQSKMSG